MPRRPLHLDDHGLAELDENDRDNLLYVLDALITRKRLKTLASGGSSN